MSWSKTFQAFSDRENMKTPFLFIVLTFLVQTAFPQTIIDTTVVSGVWTRKGSPYIIKKTIEVAGNSTLVVEPGVVVKFDPGTALNVYYSSGLVAKGTKDSMIVFTANTSVPKPGDWSQIFISGTGSKTHLAYCRIEYAATGIEFYAYSSGCTYRDNFSIMEYCEVTKTKNYAIRCYARGSSSSGCTWPTTGESDPTIRYNKIFQNQGVGIWMVARPGYLASGGAVGPKIYENEIINNGLDGIYTEWDDYVNPNIYNNTIHGNGKAGIHIVNNEDSVYYQIKSNIISQNNDGGIWVENGKAPVMKYNNVWQNKGFDYKGVVADSSNISKDPNFVNAASGDFHLKCTSPCIDAGDPGLPKNPDSTRADIGAYWYDHSANKGTITGNHAAPICEGETILLTASAGVSYRWQGPNNYSGNGRNVILNNATGAMGGNYTVTITDSAGCTALASAKVIVKSCVPIISSFSYEMGCKETRVIELTGKNFGAQKGNGQVFLGKNEMTNFSSWSDTLVQFNAKADSIEGRAIIIKTGARYSDTIPADKVYTPYAQLVGGEVSGVWTAACPSTYILISPITIPVGKTLTIEPGVTVLVDTNRVGKNGIIQVDGALTAAGKAHLPILFSVLPTQKKPGAWKGIKLDMKSSAAKVTLRHCLVEYAENGATISDSDVSIDSCVFRNNAQNGVLFDVSNESVNGALMNSHIYDNQEYGVNIYSYCTGTSSWASPTISNNIIENNGLGGLLIESVANPPFSGYSLRTASSSPQVINNIIRSHKSFGIQCSANGNWSDAIPSDFFYSAYASPRLEGNLIYDNEKGGFSAITYPSGGGHWLSYSEPEIVNCTFVQNGGVGILAGDSSKVSVVNTIVTGTAPSGQEKGGGILKASHSTFLPSFPGTKMVDQAPLFQDQMAGDFHLMPGSPQIDAGDNTEANETKDLAGKTRIVDGNKDGKAVVDIGALEYQVAITPVNSVALPNPIRVFPNPAQEEVFVEYSGASVRLHIQLFDLSGRRLNDFGIRELGSGQSQRLLLGRLPSGTYFLEFKGEGYRFAYKVVAGR